MLATFPSPTPRQPSPPRGGGLHEVAGGLGEDVGVGELEGDRPDRGNGLRLRVLAEDRARLFAERGVRLQHLAGAFALGADGGLANRGVEEDRTAGRIVDKRHRDAVDVDDDGPRGRLRRREPDLRGEIVHSLGVVHRVAFPSSLAEYVHPMEGIDACLHGDLDGARELVFVRDHVRRLRETVGDIGVRVHCPDWRIVELCPVGGGQLLQIGGGKFYDSYGFAVGAIDVRHLRRG